MSLNLTYYAIAIVSALQLLTYNCSQLSWQGVRVIAQQESYGNRGFTLVSRNGCVQKTTLLVDNFNKACGGLENNCK